jgi:hypothetical protein
VPGNSASAFVSNAAVFCAGGRCWTARERDMHPPCQDWRHQPRRGGSPSAAACLAASRRCLPREAARTAAHRRGLTLPIARPGAAGFEQNLPRCSSRPAGHLSRSRGRLSRCLMRDAD